MRKTLAELEALPELNHHVPVCMCCGKPTPSGYCEIIVYRHSETGQNVTFEEARFNQMVDEVTTAGVCHDCNDRLYAGIV